MKNRIPKEQVTSDGQSRIQVRFEAEEELDPEATIRKFRIAQTEGPRRRF